MITKEMINREFLFDKQTVKKLKKNAYQRGYRKAIKKAQKEMEDLIMCYEEEISRLKKGE